ncbi:hypothetical protein [Vibrio nigripulchritudo]|nr:hypothetical protein [Vibrio nigripulchritudo]BDU42893.1 hypothetical protein TUMSATVNIG3_16910 [Vibrio nigripulchritudo]
MPFVLPLLLFGAGTGTGVWLSDGASTIKWLIVAALALFAAFKLGVFA